MEYSIVFYAAKRTALCEKALKRNFSRLACGAASSVFAAGRAELGDQISKSFSRHDLVFVIGGLDFGDARRITAVIGQALEGARADDVKKLYGGSKDGYLIRAGRQLLVLLPDSPEVIKTVARGCLCGYIEAAGA